MTDNMTDITLKKEKIIQLLAKQQSLLNQLNACPSDQIAVQDVTHWINDLVHLVVPEEHRKPHSSHSPPVNGLQDIESRSTSESHLKSNHTNNENIDSIDSNDCPINGDNSSVTEVINSDNNCDNSCDQNSAQRDKSLELLHTLDDISVNNIDNKSQTEDKEDSNGSELSSDDNCDQSMESNKSAVESESDNKDRNHINKDKESSDSSDVEFDDLSDSPDSDNDSDSDYQINGKSGSRQTTQRLSKYERLSRDFRLKCEPVVALIRLEDNIIDVAIDEATSAGDSLQVLEKQLFDSLSAKGVICRKMKTIRPKDPNDSKSKKDTKEDGSEDKEFRRLYRIPKLNSAKNSDKLKTHSKSDDLNDSNNSERSGSERSSRINRKVKTSTPLKPNNDSDSNSDCDVSNVLNNNSLNKVSNRSKTLDVLDSDVSTDEEMKKKDNKKNIKKNAKKSDGEEDNCDNEVKANHIKSESPLKRNANKGLRRGVKNELKDGEEKEESKSVIDIDSNSDEEVVPKRKATKRRLSDDEDYCEDNKVSDKESSDESSVEESDGMDPSAQDSDSGSDRKSKKKSKKSKKKSKKDKKGKRRRVKIDDSSDDDCKVLSDENDSPNKSRKNLKKIISDKKLKKQTKDAAEAERDRRKRILDKQKEYNDLIKTRSLKSADVKELILEFDKESKEVLVEVDKTLVQFLKPHQLNGIQFMYDCIVETIDQLESSEGSGAILAHSMGLGKTLQVITFLHTILSQKEINKHIKRALVICPVNTIKNWANEFRIWLNDNDLDNILVFEMFDAKTPAQRAELMRIWHKRGGVLIIGLTLFSSLVMGGRGKKPPKFVRDAIQTCLLDPGPDVVICDEGHLLKNEKTAYNKAVSKLKTLRRVVLTGTPLQNNLSEYHVMVHFVKPNLLGTKKEFINRFVNPITNGQHVDSTDYDVKIMKKRVHILHTLLNGCVHRCDYNVLVPYLQPKHEFVISVALTQKQIELYSYYLKNLTDKQRMSLLADYGVLRLVWNHPILLFEQHKRRLERANDESMDEFIDDDEDTPESGDSDIECVDDNKAGPSRPVPKRRMRTRYGNAEEEEEEEVKPEEPEEPVNDGMSTAWFAPYLNKEEANQIELSGKFILLFAILEECEKLGDKILLFSQSLDTLDLVEEMLRLRTQKAREEAEDKVVPEIDLESNYANDATNIWQKNVDYFRLDGSTGSDYRKVWIDLFNEETNYRARLFLISTKAGGLGINLVGANRCIIFDASWNPTHDVQAIFRIFRFGQKKPVYVYRFVAQGTMEEKIYERQIIKQSLSCRVVDEQSIQRHFKASELSELYVFNPAPKEDRPIPKVPKDRLLAELLIKHKEFIVNYHEHDSLLENKPEEEMSEEEKLSAWNEYEQEKDQLFLREQQERDQRIQREYLMAQQQAQQQYQQQFLQQQQQQQYQRLAQQMYQQMQSQNPQMAQNQDNYQSLLQNQIYQNIMKSQALLRKQQQQQFQQQQQQQMRAQTTTSQQTASGSQQSGSTGLPGYDRLTIEDIGTYLKNLNKDIDPKTLIQRIFAIIDTGLNTCSKELESVKAAIRAKPSPELTPKYEKLAKEVFNLNLQKTRAQTMFKTASVPNILRGNAYQSNLGSNEEFITSGSLLKKPSDILIEEVD